MARLWRRRRTYLDIAAGVSANPSSPHEEGRAAREALEGARVTIARLLEAKPDDVIFTSGATEANALAILGATRAALAAGGKPHVLYLPSAHASIIENVKQAEREGARIEPLPLKGTQVDCGALARMLQPDPLPQSSSEARTVLVSMEAVCGETGVVWNTHEVANTLRSAGMPPTRGAPAARSIQPLAGGMPAPLLHVDASQAAWSEKLQRAHFGADLITLDASKVSPARGVGCLVAPRAIPLVPLYAGGGQERGLRPGSEAPALAMAFAAGLARAQEGREAFCAAAAAARAELVTSIYGGVPRVVVNEGASQAPHILNISLPGRDTDYVVALLNEAGFAISTVSACESASGEPSRAVWALWGDKERAAATLRVSWGPAVGAPALRRFAGALVVAVRFIDSTRSA